MRENMMVLLMQKMSVTIIMALLWQTEKIILKLQRHPPAHVLSLLVLLSARCAACMTKLFHCYRINFRYQTCIGVH